MIIEWLGLCLEISFDEQSLLTGAVLVTGIEKLSRIKADKDGGIFLSRFKVESEKWILMKVTMKFWKEITTKSLTRSFSHHYLFI